MAFLKKYSEKQEPSQRSPKRLNKLVAECLAIEAASAKEVGMLAFMARAMAMATLSHSKPDGYAFQRKNGDYILTMMANPQFGLPYGSLPRLLLAWMTREAKRTGSPILHLGKTFSEFLQTLKLSQSGGQRGDATRLREQMLRLFTTHISCLYQNKKEGVCKSDQFLVTRSFELWWNPLKENPAEISQTSTITLAKDFFDELIDRPVPVDFRVLQALRRSPLQIDIYVWLTYRFSYLKRPTLIPWNLLIHQFGSDYAADAQGLRGFKKQFLKALHVVTVIYTDAKVDIQGEGIVLKPSQSHIKSRQRKGGRFDMLVIHIFHVFTKLFTLKHSRFSAETLPLSIYTYSYLYKRTCSYQLQVVNNFFLKRFLSCLTIACITIFATACSNISPAEKTQEAALHLSPPPHKHFEQVQSDELHSSAYFTCGEWHNPCHSYSKINIKKVAKTHSMKGKSTSIIHQSSGGK